MTSSSSPEPDLQTDFHTTLDVSGNKTFLKRIIRPRYFAFAATFIMVSAVMAGYGHYTDPGPLPENEDILIPHGGMKKVVTVLQEHKILSSGRISALFFEFVTKLTVKEGPIQAAEFSFPARVSIAHALDILRHGKAVSHNITIAEGLTAAQISKILQDTPFLTGDMPALKEGEVFPQTFSYQRETERSVLVLRMKHLMDVTVQKLWDGRDKKALDGLINTPQELVILASLIERETSLESEKPHVARVFLNRMKIGMRLQTDPTVIYALTNGKSALDHSLTHEELLVDSPYNTYQVKGLPPGPICSPGLNSLKAAAHPAEGNELYFVATGKGGHNFANTLEEQTRHVRAYRHAIMSAPK